MIYYKSLLLSILIGCYLCAEEIQFTVSKISIGLLPCMSSAGEYSFDIEGEFSGDVKLDNEIYVDMASPKNVQAKCVPYEKTIQSSSKLHCIIDVCFSPLNEVKLMLPLIPPKSEKIKIQKWEEVIGAEDGKSNLVEENVDCTPYESNTFIPTSLVSKGCSLTKNTFSINGEWENQEKIPSDSFDFKIRIDNDKKDIAECKFESKNVKQLDCSFDGEGDIKFGEKYFLGKSIPYKMQKTEISIHVDKCSDSDPDRDPDSKSNSTILFLNFLSLAVLLLF
jgi:hypothetical protein